ncbi:MAG: hypothetical protein ACOCW2_04050, partial [Chitinivibrionales bacterium]
MYRFIMAAAACFLTVSAHSWAQEFTCTFDAGLVQVKPGYSSAWGPMHSGENAGIGDSLKLQTTEGALISLSEDAAVVVKDSALLKIAGTADNLIIHLDEGEILLSRDKGADPTPVWIMAKGCSFTPIGTKAAVKITPEGNPSVAVVEGAMKVTDPAGKSLDVGGGSFATFNAGDRSFRQGKLPPDAVNRINSWSDKNLDKQPSQVAANKTEASEHVAQEKKAEPKPEIEEEVVTPPAGKVMQMDKPETETASKNAAGDIAKENDNQKPADKAVKAQTKPKKQNVSTKPAGMAKPAATPQPKADEPAQQESSAQAKTSTVPATDNVGTTPAGNPTGPTYAVDVGMVTVDGENWNRIAFMIDVPIWRFGIGLDVEFFVNDDGLSSKGWSFSEDEWAETLYRKIRYLRFNHEGDAFFAKFGGLSSVTMGYGFVVDRFTNMLRYPDEKQLGLRIDLNDVSPLGITLQTMIADVQDFSRDGGIVAARLGVKPFKPAGVPILQNLLIAGTYASDLNQYAPARDWDYTLKGPANDRDEDDITDGSWQERNYTSITGGDTLTAEQRANAIANGIYDTDIEHKDQWAEKAENSFAIVGGDVSIPIIKTKILGLDLYGQGAMNLDDDDSRETRGWGIGAPGVAANIGPLWARLEYRQVDGRFEPGYFGPYYLEERIKRSPEIQIKEEILDENDQDLKGVFGTLGMDIGGVFVLSGTYQRLIGDDNVYGDQSLDQRFEL